MLVTSKPCYCAFCRSERVVYRKRHLSFIDLTLAGSASVLLSFIVWQTLDPRALMFFAFGLGVAELFVQVRWRLSIACPHCGFDPVLYKKNREKAAERVKAFLEIRRDDPMSVFSPLNLPVVKRPPSKQTPPPESPSQPRAQ